MAKWLENRVSQLDKEIADLKVDFEHLNMIYNNSTCCSDNQLIVKPCENCTLLETCARFTRRKANLEVILGSQNCVFGRSGTGYNSFNKKKVKKFAHFFSNNASSDISLTTWNYCLRKGHISKICKARKYDVPKGFMKWILKGLRKA